MLLFIFLAIMTTLAISQGLLLLFLIRSRGHMLHLSSQIIRLQTMADAINASHKQIDELTSRVNDLSESERMRIEERNVELSQKVVPLAAVGS